MSENRSFLVSQACSLAVDASILNEDGCKYSAEVKRAVNEAARFVREFAGSWFAVAEYTSTEIWQNSFDLEMIIYDEYEIVTIKISADFATKVTRDSSRYEDGVRRDKELCERNGVAYFSLKKPREDGAESPLIKFIAAIQAKNALDLAGKINLAVEKK